MQQLVGRFGATYGLIHYLGPAEIKALAGSDTVTGDEYNPPMLVVTRWDLVRCLPNLYWANIFGPEYVSLFGGIERVRQAPASVIREIAAETIYLQLSDDMRDVENRHAEMAERRECTKRFLGADCFFNDETRFKGRYRVPELGWEEPARPPLSVEDVLGEQGH